MASAAHDTNDIFTPDAMFTPWWWETAPRPDHSEVPVPPEVNAAVARIDGRRGAFEVATARGRSRARDVIVATNGYTGV